MEPQWQLISERRKLARLKLREGKQLAQDHTASTWQSQDEETKNPPLFRMPSTGMSSHPVGT